MELRLRYRVTARNKEEAEAAAWLAHDEELIPEVASAVVERVG